jgi:hypothetical protein
VKQSTVLEKLKELDAQRDQLLLDAKKDALARAEEAVSELNALGFHYYLGEGDARPIPARRSNQPVATKSARHVPKDHALSANSALTGPMIADRIGCKSASDHSTTKNLKQWG